MRSSDSFGPEATELSIIIPWHLTLGVGSPSLGFISIETNSENT
jgi:hypothetical protein